jgi:hypothetical protein
MTRRIGSKFEELKSCGKKAFIPFIMAGDPDLETTIRVVLELERSGSHIVELGIPFSDPVADGPTIQRAALRALRHHYSLSDYLQAIQTIRQKSNVPILLFSYFNPIFQYGLESLARDASAAGVDGILITDITPEESEEYCQDCGLFPRFYLRGIACRRYRRTAGAFRQCASNSGTCPQAYSASGCRRLWYFTAGTGSSCVANSRWSCGRKRHRCGNGAGEESASGSSKSWGA